jgi:glycine betaine/proline transport system ATP-binding protein
MPGSLRPARRHRRDGALLATHEDRTQIDAHPIPKDCLLRAPDAIPALSLDRVYKLFGNRRRVRAASAAIASGARGDRETLKSAYGVFAALAGVDLHVAPREILGIVGASGSGKSTLIRHMNGLIHPSHGGVAVAGEPLDCMPRRALQRLRATRVGMVFQSTSLFPHRTVIDNVAFGLEVRGMARDARYGVARLWLDRVELSKWANHYPGELSGGMQQRVGLARTFAPDPETLLLDEPFSALDPILRRSLQDQFLALVGEFQKTAVFVTHDFAEAVRLADRIAVMAEGRIVQLGTPRELVFHPTSSYVASFATPEIRRSLTCAADIAAGQEHVCLRETSSACLLGGAPLADVVARLQREDICLNIKGADGRTIGWIDRDVLLRHVGEMLRAQTPF